MTPLLEGHFFVLLATPSTFAALWLGTRKICPCMGNRTVFIRFATKMLSNLRIECRVLHNTQLNY